MKKIAKISALVILCLFAIAFAAPFIFKGKIITLIKTEANRNLNARLDFSDASVSLFRHFPKISIQVQNLSLAGVDEFSSDTLISASQIDIAMNLMSVISGNKAKVSVIYLDEPRIHVIVHKNGHANWSIVKSDSSAGKEPQVNSGQFKLELQKYVISSAYIHYQDETSGMSSEIIQLNHEGSGDFTSELFTLKTKTSAAEVNFVYGGIPYLVKTKTSLDADIEINNKTNTYTFKTDQIAMNDLKIHAEGFFQLLADAYNMDIRFNAPSTDFKNILSLIPAIYQKDFASIKTMGQLNFGGYVKGKYDKSHIPAYQIALDIKNGFFQYPDLPKSVKNINASCKVDNPDGTPDHTVVNIPQAHFEIDDAPFDFHLILKNPLSDQFIDGGATGKLDLSVVDQLMKLDHGTKVKGELDAAIEAKGNLAALEKKQYDQFKAAGHLALKQFKFQSDAYPDGILLSNLLLTFNPGNVTLNDLTGEYLKTKFNAHGTVNNLLAYALKNKTLDGSLQFKADNIDLDKWMGISSDTTGSSNASAPFAVPSNLQFVVQADVDKVHYNKLDMQQVGGSLVISDETVRLVNVHGNALDGTISMSGSYSTKENKKKPAVDLSYDVKNLNIQKTFLTFNTVEKIMPIGRYMDGKISSQLKLKGQLGDQLNPDVNTLTGDGNLLVLEGVINKFEPLDKLVETLHLDPLKNISLKDVKTEFSFRNGRVIVNPFKIKVKDIQMEIGGSHGFDQTLDYAIRLQVPRSMMGSQANMLVNNLVTQVNSKGVPLKASDIIHVNVKMGGTISNPVVKPDWKEGVSSTASNLKQQANDFVKAQVDSAKLQLKDTMQSVKKQVARDAMSELKKQMTNDKDSNAVAGSGGLDDSKKKVEETGKGLINGLFKKKK